MHWRENLTLNEFRNAMGVEYESHRKTRFRRLPICLLVICLVVSPIALILLSISFATEYWLVITVDRNQLTRYQLHITSDLTDIELSRIAHSRAVGIFWECYYTNATKFLEKAPGSRNRCFQVTYHVPEHKKDRAFSFQYWQRLQLKRTHLASMAMALISCFVGFVLGILMWNCNSYRLAITASFFMVITGFLISLGMAVFHAVEFIETNTIKDPDERLFRKYWPLYIKHASVRSYGWSYMLGWTSMALSAIPATLYGLIAFHLKGDEYHDISGDRTTLSEYMGSVSTISRPIFSRKLSKYHHP